MVRGAVCSFSELYIIVICFKIVVSVEYCHVDRYRTSNRHLLTCRALKCQSPTSLSCTSWWRPLPRWPQETLTPMALYHEKVTLSPLHWIYNHNFTQNIMIINIILTWVFEIPISPRVSVMLILNSSHHCPRRTP